MEHQNTLNLLNEVGDSEFINRNWNIVNNQSKLKSSITSIVQKY